MTFPSDLDDAQAMALVKEFGLQIGASAIKPYQWCVISFQEQKAGRSEDLNRAICECVAEIQKDKK